MKASLCTAITLTFLMILALGVAVAAPADNPEFKRALELEESGRVDDALAIYERLYANDANDLYFWKLISIHERAGRWERLEKLARDKLAVQPDNIELSRYLARALHGRGDLAAARETLLAILDDRWDEKALVQFVAAEFQSYGEYREAVNVFLSAREYIGEPAVFAAELGLLYRYEESYLDAIHEYAQVLDTYTAAYSYAVQLVSEAQSDGAESEQIAAPFRNYIESHPESMNAGRILSVILASAGEYEEAYRIFCGPAIATGNYSELWRFIELVESDGQAKLAADAYDDFVRAFPGNASVMLARKRAADLLAGIGDLDEAARRYRSIAGDYAGTYEAAEAELGLLALTRDTVDYEEFTGMLTVFADTTAFREASCKAYRMLGDMYLTHGNTEAAGESYMKEKLAAESRRDRYESSIRLATYAFFTGVFEQMGPELQQAIAVMPEGTEINDLFAERILFMSCVTDHDRERFTTYAAGQYAVYRGDMDEAEELFAVVAGDSSTMIAPAAAVALADLNRDGGRTDEAIGWYLRAADMADDATILSGALLEAAKLAETMPDGGPARARELYVRALTDHPGTVHDAELRTRLQAVLEP